MFYLKYWVRDITGIVNTSKVCTYLIQVVFKNRNLEYRRTKNHRNYKFITCISMYKLIKLSTHSYKKV